MSVSSAVTKPLFDHFDVLVVLTHMVSTRVCSSDGNERVGERDAANGLINLKQLSKNVTTTTIECNASVSKENLKTHN